MLSGFTAQVRMAHDSGMPEDTVINTFHFGNDADPEDYPAIVAALEDFYNTTYGTFQPSDVASHISSAISRTVPVEVRIYDTTTTGPSGIPVFTDDFILDAPDAIQALPSEVACVNSVYAGPSSPGATGRGRQYIGPLNGKAVEAITGGQVVVSTTLREALVGASQALRTATPANPWCVRTVSGGVVDFAEVEGGFVDSAFDTQRRRGEKSIVRNSWHV